MTDGVSDASSVVTDDGQLGIGFLPGAFDVGGKSTISVSITPVSPCPNPADLHFATNAYEITATAQLVKDATLKLDFSGNVPSPSNVYFASDPGGPWMSIGAAATAQPYTIDTTTPRFGYFAAGYSANAISTGSASQLLPIAVAVLIVGVLIASVPLALLRRRRGAGSVNESEEVDQ